MHVVVLSIGPVQDFIASARRCRDLWFGSWLLSELSRAAARGLVEKEARPEAEVLAFPGVSTEKEDRAVANKIVARLQGNPDEVMAVAERTMRGRLREIREAAFARVAPNMPDRDRLFRIATARQQVDELIEFLWAAAPEKDGYAAARAEAERLLAAVKSSREWGQPPWAEDGVPKSSLDGLRESVLDEGLYDRPRVEVERRGLDAHRLRRAFGVHGAERLCGVGLLKRFGNRDADASAPGDGAVPHRIFSTPHIASGPYRAGLNALPGADVHWKRLCAELKGSGVVRELSVVPQPDPLTGRVDGLVFYEGRLAEEVEECAESDQEKESLVLSATRALRAFRDGVRELGEPIPYYALLLADGDNMGAAIEACPDFEGHRQLSASIEEFSAGVRDQVRQHGGSLVYAGGDDVLAFLPLHQVVSCAVGLEQKFNAIMSPWKYRDTASHERSPTLSVGIAIVHQLLPLDEALDLVRGAERRAKSCPSKNSVAIVVKRRGGEAIEAAGSFRTGSLPARLAYLTWLHRTDRIPGKAQYELMDLAERTAGSVSDAERATLQKIAATEAKRILARKQPRGEESGLAAHIIDALGKQEAFSDPARLGRELYVASELARAETQARMPIIPPDNATTP